jgi:hypothetical protein
MLGSPHQRKRPYNLSNAHTRSRSATSYQTREFQRTQHVQLRTDALDYQQAE